MDRAATYPIVLELLPAPWHRTKLYANNRAEADHGRLKSRLRPMRGPKQDRSASMIIGGHAFVQNVRRGHYELAAEELANRRWQSRSTSWPWRSEFGVASRLHHALARPNATAPSGALDGGGRTIVVLGYGVDVPYPRRNGDLFRRIREAGGTLLPSIRPARACRRPTSYRGTA
jgi:hypothetical protein